MNQSLPLQAEVPAEDLSGRIISEIMGKGWDSLTGGELSSQAVTLAHDILSAFNWVALAGVSVLFILVMLQGIAGTAHEGVPFGRRFSALWMPLRFAGAMSFLAPVFKGLSLFQLFLLMAVGYSVNLANFVWDTGLDFFVESGGRISLKAPENIAQDAEDLGNNILRSLVIQEYYAQSLDDPISGPFTPESFFPTVGNVEGQYLLTFQPPPEGRLKPGDLGRIRVPCPDPDEYLCGVRLAAVRGLITELAPLASKIASPTHPLTRAEGMVLATAIHNYELAIQPYLDVADELQSEVLGKDLKEFQAVAQQGGWVTAGAYYWTIARLNERSRQILYQGVVFSEGLGIEAMEGEVLADFEAVMERYNRYVSGAYTPERSVGATGVAAEFPSVAWVNDKLSGALGRYGLNRLIDHLETGDPIATLASLGNFLITSAELVIGIRIAFMGVAHSVGDTSTSLFGQIIGVFTGNVSTVVAGMVQGVIAGLGPYLLLLSVLLISYGFFLAYFLPALPFILWISGVLGWLILVMESLVAAPLWVAAHALPEGEGLAGNAGRKGYMLFLGVLLRPPLMVFGFLIAMALLNGVGRVIGHIFGAFGFAFLGESFLGVSGFMAFSVILGISVVTATWKLFGLMSHLPDRVINWIGEHIHSLGEREEARSFNANYREAGTISTRMINPVTTPDRGNP
ncbi:MAG: DotA/TraY family protein [Deltaproteobacteria bacterium]|jgi:hypothetical protein|nr:DotA/TraY family protein [Deltaproteobacteria bacterium]